jgi:hypothetical protein
VYLYYFYDKKIDSELSIDILRVSIAKVFTGWTLDYIDSLSMTELTRVQGILEGQAKYEKKLNSQKGKK